MKYAIMITRFTFCCIYPSRRPCATEPSKLRNGPPWGLSAWKAVWAFLRSLEPVSIFFTLSPPHSRPTGDTSTPASARPPPPLTSCKYSAAPASLQPPQRRRRVPAVASSEVGRFKIELDVMHHTISRVSGKQRTPIKGFPVPMTVAYISNERFT